MEAARKLEHFRFSNCGIVTEEKAKIGGVKRQQNRELENQYFQPKRPSQIPAVEMDYRLMAISDVTPLPP
jgi:hypothetical protein